jgi:hypothetical protein
MIGACPPPAANHVVITMGGLLRGGSGPFFLNQCQMNSKSIVNFYFVNDGYNAKGQPHYHADYMDRDRLRKIISELLKKVSVDDLKPLVSYCRMRDIQI